MKDNKNFGSNDVLSKIIGVLLIISLFMFVFFSFYKPESNEVPYTDF